MSLLDRFKGYIRRLVKTALVLTTKLSLLILVGGAVGLGWTWLFYTYAFVPNGYFKTVLVLALAVTTGLIARMVFHKNKFLTAWLAASLSLTLTLWWLFEVSRGLAGFNLIEAWISEEPNWDGLWQMGLAMGLIWITLSVWRSPSRRIKTGPSEDVSGHDDGFEPQGTVVAPLHQRKQAHSGMTPRKTTSRVKKTKKGEALISLGHYNKTMESSAGMKGKELKPEKQSMVKTGKKRSGRAALNIHRSRSKGLIKPIKFVGSEEHRCPYCLDIVDPNDPAGVVICSVCHTYHHKSCWDVTGTCQVPHIHE